MSNMKKETLMLVGAGVIIVVLVFFAIQMKNNEDAGSESLTQQNIQNDNTIKQDLVENKNIKNNMRAITIGTTLGNIVFETYDADAPLAVENFVKLAEKGFYDNVIFHRVIKGFMIQGGDPTGTGSGGPGYSFQDELNPNAESYKRGYKRGVVAMANAGANTNGSQFFIMLQDNPLPNNYTIFGKVVSGQDVVDAIGNLETGPNDRPLNPPYIKDVRVEARK